MPDLNRNLPRIDTSRFSMVPRADVPRSTFITQHNLKTTFEAGYLVPILVKEILPGDHHQGEVDIFARLSTPVFPIMDALRLETFFFFVPARILWSNWKRFMGERDNPADSISYTVPQIASPVNGWAVCSLFDYMGLPTVGQINGGEDYSANVLPLRAYNRIWNDWFRDQNLQNAAAVSVTDGPDATVDYPLRRRNKRHDYFTSALPWPLKGGVDVTLPLLGQAPVRGIISSSTNTDTSGMPAGTWRDSSGQVQSGWNAHWTGPQIAAAGNLAIRASSFTTGAEPQIFADLSLATGATINALRMAVQTQRLLERDARSGTRYTELLRAHFGVTPEDARLQRPEYVGGGRTYLNTQAIPQTSATGLTGGTSPIGALGAAATASDRHSFTLRATEHGYLIGLANLTAEVTYQQGVHRLWTRLTRYDFYLPVFAHLGEQAIRNDEIFATGNNTDANVWAYQERWAEYRHEQGRITGLFKSRSAGTIDPWHLAQNFAGTVAPTFSATFLEDNPPMSRVLATAATNMHLLWDSVFRIRSTRPMPMYSVPGGMDRF